MYFLQFKYQSINSTKNLMKIDPSDASVEQNILVILAASCRLARSPAAVSSAGLPAWESGGSMLASQTGEDEVRDESVSVE